MIRKPADGWGQENPAFDVMRNAAAGGKAAVQTGGRMIRGGYLCLLGGIFLLGALAGGAGGSMPTLIGAGLIGVLLMGAGLKAFKPATGAVEASYAAAAAAFAPAQAISSVDYSRGKLLAQAGLAVVFLGICLGGLGQTGGMLRLLATLMIPLAGVLALASARKAFGDLTALRWDARGVTVNGMLKSHTLPWSSVESVAVEQLNTYAYGFVKVSSRRILTIRRADRMIGKRLSLSLSLLDLGGRSPDAIVASLQAALFGRASASAFEAPPQAPPTTATAAAPRFAAPQPSPQYAPAPSAWPAPAAPRHASSMNVPPYAAYGAGPSRTTFGRRGA